MYFMFPAIFNNQIPEHNHTEIISMYSGDNDNISFLILQICVILINRFCQCSYENRLKQKLSGFSNKRLMNRGKTHDLPEYRKIFPRSS